ncbi:DUF6329 domain-containing protein [Erysipelothrix anatis]|uniref:DUF6329 domain-containing protein n=1 Tax=Erysipelothrix anatis TaxID=2683713 RepID=UPI001A9FC501|nr:DUF6329 domain-containing protein [Erysipelothrix anatis]
MLITKAIFEAEISAFDPVICVIDTIEIMDAMNFENFSENLLENQEFIIERKDKMYIDSAAQVHTLLVMDDEGGDGILIDASQQDEPKYVAFMPNIKPYIENQIAILANEIIRNGTQNTPDGSDAIYFEDIQEQFAIPIAPNDGIGTLLLRTLTDKDEIVGIEMKEDRFDINYNLDFCPCFKDEKRGKQQEPVSAMIRLKDLLRTCWEDIHLLHRDVEIEPATIVELNEHTLTDAGKEAWADILNAQVFKVYNGCYGLQMELAGVEPYRLEKFSAMLAGYCPVSDYEKWVAPEDNTHSQSPSMNQ